MTKRELASLTVAELKALAKKKKVALPAGARKAEIIEALAEGKAEAGRTPVKTTAVKQKAPAKGKAAAKGKTAVSPRARSAAKRTKQADTAAGRKGAATTSPSAGRTPAKGPAVKRVSEREWRMPAGREEPIMAQERVADAKFYTGTPVARPEEPSGALPHEYGQEQFTLLVRDPHTVFAFWEMPQQRLDRGRERMGRDSRLCVRIYDVTGVAFDGRNEVAYFDQEVYERVGSWYFDLGRAGRAFCADLGLRTPDGRFQTLLRSNAISMPREGFSDVVDEEWTVTEEDFLKLYGAPGPGGISSAEVRELMRKRRLLEVSSPGMSGRQKERPRRR
jgi:hypothetical protein